MTSWLARKAPQSVNLPASCGLRLQHYLPRMYVHVLWCSDCGIAEGVGTFECEALGVRSTFIRNSRIFPMNEEPRARKASIQQYSIMSYSKNPFRSAKSPQMKFPIRPPPVQTSPWEDVPEASSSRFQEVPVRRKNGNRVLIAVFGTTGTGKTTLIEKISGKKLNIGHDLRSCKAAYLIAFLQSGWN